MKRPEGFDRQAPAVRPETPVAPAESKPETAEPVRSKAARSTAARSTPTARSKSERTTVAPATPAPSKPDLPVKAPRATSPAAESGVPAPVDLPREDHGAAEARDRAREARREARRAAVARRAVERTEVRRFTRRTRHRRATLITAGAIVLALVATVTISVFSPALSLQTITVQGTSRVDKAQVLSSLDAQIGKPLALIDFTAVKKDLSEFPLIESYVTETKPPHTLVIRITEREPIASVKVGTTYELVDPAGVVIATSTKKPAGVPVIGLKGGTVDGKVFRSTAEVLLALPAELLKKVASVSASTADDVTLKLTGGEQVVWGSADQSAKKAQLLTGLIRDHNARDPDQSVQYDVSAPDNGIIRTK